MQHQRAEWNSSLPASSALRNQNSKALTILIMSLLSSPLLKGMTKWHIVQGTPSSYKTIEKTAAPRMMFSVDSGGEALMNAALYAISTSSIF
ncbi:hypothetical protein P9D34_18080 [Bacillus swezeyi]|uniref:hypothetical protein n=1 Tax=Bacillus swezeyi TaxID=1925020 RepID=UPI000976EC9F|nr:hypothetical protein [Bacillus swezeyi]MEC1262291.1 hypothetical protein [Bacillus swezeyi]MED2927141.1 hypothetical protein [Bacillus swezeyi]MED2941373.1 hypothetical protein [Bacillus swezeyi]MED2962339.1 hypothetical protein [Bacillus swezeyi]MED2979787.1 hypothetical protein [Bacillus swezeyi]